MLSRTGYLIPKSDWTDNDKKGLTVRPIVNGDYGVRPPPFRVYRTSKANVCVPRYYKPSPPPIDKRPEPKGINVAFTGKLRDSTSQNEAHDAIVKVMRTTGGGLLSLPCGYGKTTVALAVASTMKVRTMIVVHKEFLANQWRERIQQFCPGATIGIIQQNKFDINCDFVVAMLQTISMKDFTLDQFESIGMVIVDEAHHICARVFSQAFFKFCPKYSLGLSATPVRKDGLTDVLHWFLGPPAFAVERENRGRTIVRTLRYKCSEYRLPPPVTRFGKVSLVQMITDLVENAGRNEFLEIQVRKIMKNSGRRLLVLSDRRQHCEEMACRLEDLGTGLYMGGMKEAKLKESAEQNIIVGTFSQAHEGLDIPVLDTVLLATPKSDVKQAVGRILRETEGKKNDPIILDVADDWGLMGSMYYKRRKMYKESGFEIEKEIGEPIREKETYLKGYAFLDIDSD